MGGWVDSRAGLDGCGKTRPHRDSISELPARSELQYRLSYLGPHIPYISHSSYVVLEKQYSQEVRNNFSFLIALHGHINVISIFVSKLPVNACKLFLFSVTLETHERKYEHNSKCSETFERKLKQNAIYDI
jgi:hypothetical protein